MSTTDDKKSIIAIFSHPDDELGAIGTLSNHVNNGDEVYLTWTTYGEYTTFFPDLTPEEVKREREKHGYAVKKFIGANDVHFFDIGDGMVENNRESRIEIAKYYTKIKPNAIITWGTFNSHSDHRATSQLALEAIQFARINKIVGDNPHRKNVVLLTYFEKQSGFPVKFIDVGDQIDKILEVSNFYGEIYGWKNVEKWMRNSRIANGREAGCEYAEKFNVRFQYKFPSKLIFD
jgi:N-acetylglucosamine malate deacetylase 1